MHVSTNILVSQNTPSIKADKNINSIKFFQQNYGQNDKNQTSVF